MKSLYFISTLFLLIIFNSCKKDWLDAKPNKALVVPQTIENYQALLDNSGLFYADEPALGEISSDDYYLQYTVWQSLGTSSERNGYIWAPDIYQNQLPTGDWNIPYNQILNTNIALEGIAKVPSDNSTQAALNNVKGTALFYRAYNFYSLASLFAKPYIQATATQDLGIPLRLSSDINEKSVRSSVQQTYDQIITDLLQAKELLPVTPIYKTRPSKPAVYALLARTYLSMQQYEKALLYSDSCLNLYNALIDYNTLNPAATFPIAGLSNEVILEKALGNYGIFRTSTLIVDSLLYQSYNTNDMRQSIFFSFNAGVRFKGSYEGNKLFFGGLATDEIYLIRAECNARKGNATDAMTALNALLIKRWRTGTFTPLTASTADDALNKVLIERRKELCFRGIRWTDLRRLNQDSRYAKVLTRILNGQNYTLPPNDNRYVLPIPIQEIQLSGIQQNPR